MGALLENSLTDWTGKQELVARPGAYTRTCAYRDGAFELLLLNWSAGAASPIHDHGDQHCWMMVLDGRLEVEDYIRLDSGDVPGYAHVEGRGCRRLEAGEMDLRSGRFDLHRVANAAGGGAVTLHVYAAPLSRFLVYDMASRQCTSAVGTYDDVLAYPREAISQ